MSMSEAEMSAGNFLSVPTSTESPGGILTAKLSSVGCPMSEGENSHQPGASPPDPSAVFSGN